MLPDLYWNIIVEEEKKGNTLAEYCKRIFSHRGESGSNIISSWSSVDGEIYDSFLKIILNVSGCCGYCRMYSMYVKRNWNIKNFLGGIIGIIQLFCWWKLFLVFLFISWKEIRMDSGE